MGPCWPPGKRRSVGVAAGLRSQQDQWGAGEDAEDRLIDENSDSHIGSWLGDGISPSSGAVQPTRGFTAPSFRVLSRVWMVPNLESGGSGKRKRAAASETAGLTAADENVRAVRAVLRLHKIAPVRYNERGQANRRALDRFKWQDRADEKT